MIMIHTSRYKQAKFLTAGDLNDRDTRHLATSWVFQIIEFGSRLAETKKLIKVEKVLWINIRNCEGNTY